MLQLRPATTPTDFKAIERLAWVILPEFYVPTLPLEHVEYFLRRFQSVEAITAQVAQEFDYFLLEWHGVAAGYLGLESCVDRLKLSKLYLLKEYRGRKIGRRALEFTEQFARDRGLPLIELSVNRHNAEAIAIYQRAGYLLGELRSHHFPDGTTVEEYRMEKSLTGLSGGREAESGH